MAIRATHNEADFGVGDVVAVHQTVDEGGKTRNAVFEGVVIAISGREDTKTFTVRRVGVQKIGIEKIFPLSLPTITRIEVKRKGARGVRRAKLYYLRGKSRKETEKVYKRHSGKKQTKSASIKKAKK